MKQRRRFQLVFFALAATILGACAGENGGGATSSTATTGVTATTSGTASTAVSIVTNSPSDLVAFRDGDGPWRLLENNGEPLNLRTIGRASAEVSDAQGRYSFALMSSQGPRIFEGTTMEGTQVDTIDLHSAQWSSTSEVPWSLHIAGIPAEQFTRIYGKSFNVAHTFLRGDRTYRTNGQPTDMIALSPASGDPTAMKVISRWSLTNPTETITFNFNADEATNLEKTAMPEFGSENVQVFIETPRMARFTAFTTVEGGITQLFMPPQSSLPGDTVYFASRVAGQTSVLWAGSTLSSVAMLPALPSAVAATASRFDDNKRIYRINVNDFGPGATYSFHTSRRSYLVSEGRMQVVGGTATYTSPDMTGLAALAGFESALSDPMPNQIDMWVGLSGQPFGRMGWARGSVPPSAPGRPGVIYAESRLDDILAP